MVSVWRMALQCSSEQAPSPQCPRALQSGVQWHGLLLFPTNLKAPPEPRWGVLLLWESLPHTPPKVQKQNLMCCPEALWSSAGSPTIQGSCWFWGHQGALLPSCCLKDLQIASGSPLNPPYLLSTVFLVGSLDRRLIANSSVRNSSFKNNGSEEMGFEIQEFFISQSKWSNWN